jgi:uncharacterized membrane protein YphA (DoxX/SURF4 family)
MLHEARADLCMLLGAIYLLIVGGGGWSVDAWLARRLQRTGGPATPALRR